MIEEEKDKDKERDSKVGRYKYVRGKLWCVRQICRHFDCDIYVNDECKYNKYQISYRNLLVFTYVRTVDYVFSYR